MQPQKQRPTEATTMPPPPQKSPAPASQKALTWPDACPQTLTKMDDSRASSLRSEAPAKQSSPFSRGDGGDGGSAFVPSEMYYSPLQSPAPTTPPTDAAATGMTRNSSLAVTLGSVLSEETAPSALVVSSSSGGGERGGMFGGWKRKKKEGVVEEIVSRSRKKVVLMRAALGFRVYEVVVSLISFAVMATNNTQGWSGDSFYRYKEYRYCLSVNVIACAYAAFQAYHLTYNLVSGKQFIKHHLQFNFLMDQILAYLLMSASSAAATRVDDWQSNWGKDEFTEKASVSASMSFLAFIGFALSSLISGYNLCNREFT